MPEFHLCEGPWQQSHHVVLPVARLQQFVSHNPVKDINHYHVQALCVLSDAGRSRVHRLLQIHCPEHRAAIPHKTFPPRFFRSGWFPHTGLYQCF